MAKVQPEDRNGIEFHKGNTNILFIAPHGHPKNDTNTGKLVRALAEKTGHYAIVNETFRKPDVPDNDDSANKKNKRVNLNRIAQVETHLEEEFLKPLIKYKNEIIERFGKALLIWIHGAENASVKKDVSRDRDIKPDAVKILIGFGQHERDTRHTANADTILGLKKGLNANNLTAVEASAKKNKFCAHDRHNMTQLFRVDENIEQTLDYQDPNVESIQLEFRMKDCRDTDENIEATARNLAQAISTHIEPDEIELELELELIEDESTEDGVIAIEDSIVEKAYIKLAQVFSKNYERALMEAGQYIVRTFYGGEEGIEDQGYQEDFLFDKQVIENARNKTSPFENSLRQLCAKIEGEKSGNTPSQAWIYNAVNLVVQWHDMKKALPENCFHTYRNLLLSHKISLLKVEDIKLKQDLIEEASKQEFTAVSFKKRIAGSLPEKERRSISPSTLLRRPQELVKDEFADMISLTALKGKGKKTLANMKSLADEQSQNVQSEIEALEKRIADHNRYLERYAKVKANIEKAIEYKKAKPKKKAKAGGKSGKKSQKPTGFQEWTKRENNINISTGCSNDCKYCYAKSMAYRFKRVEQGQWVNEQVREADVNKKRKSYDGRVGFPTSHDITAVNVDAYLKVLEKLLALGNEILIVSKPNFDCIKRICQTAADHKDKILFRFTIGAMDEDILRFWDTNAPLYDERKKCLMYAHENGFGTSVSMEPLLNSSRVLEMATDLAPYVSDYIWIGKMNHLASLKSNAKAENDKDMLDHIEKIEKGQTDDKIKGIYDAFAKNPELLKKIKWKDSYKKVLKIDAPKKPGMDI